MLNWIAPITDRTRDDLQARTAKAFLNVSDWLRIYGNTILDQRAVQAIIGLNAVLTSLTQPAITEFPSVVDINTLIENIDLLREATCLPASLGLVALKHDYIAGSGAEAPNYEDVNDWERDILLIRDQLLILADYLVYCGVANCGQTRLWQNQFRRWIYVQDALSPVRLGRCGVAITGSGLTRQNYFRRYA
jgi:hypothetical protein